jgi:8-oxo-dGTP pyrophosphatase MutT (NUDIX family)
VDYYASSERTPASQTREYGQEEFLLIVDEQGVPNQAGAEMLFRNHQTLVEYPDFGKWFREGSIPTGEWSGTRVLLAARWLSHFIGLRHGTVEIFIDPPTLAGSVQSEQYTLVQVRGNEKFEAPGAFDIPCAGHITGVDTAEASLVKELAEELNITLDDLDDLRRLGRYNSYTQASNSGSINNEFRVLYRARLKKEAVAKIRFTDGEVAALAVFAVGELRSLIQRFPERIASGLSGAMDFFQVE